MTAPTSVVPYGRPATTALADIVADAQHDDPLAPVTVIVPSNFVGLSVRRLLADRGGGAPGSRRGVANVSFVTPFQLVEALAADLLPHTRPLTNPVLGAAVRRTLAAAPGHYAPVADHEATEAALAALYAELSNVDEAGLEAIVDEGSTAARSAVEFYRAIADRLAGFHTEHDLAIAAAERDDLAVRLRPFGHLVWYLPTPLTPALGLFVGRALSDSASCSVIVGVTGDTDADEPVWRSCAAAGVTASPADRSAASRPVGDRIVSVTDAPEEVREVCRRVLGLVAAGTPPERIGVFYPAPAPYARIIEQQFRDAGIVANGPDQRRLADSVAGRTLLRALELPDARWRRDRVMSLLSAGPLRMRGERVRPAAWDDVSRDAGVVADLADWRAKIQHHCAVTEHRLDQLSAPAEGDTDWRAQRLVDRIADARALLDFVEQLARSVRTVTQAATWPDKCGAASALMTDLLGPEHQHAWWPEAEQEAFARVDAALVRLAALQDVEPTPSAPAFVRALRAELDVSRGRVGRFGHGVVYGPIAAAVGFDLDAVFVVGAAEGLLPLPRRDDAILPEAVRISSLDQLESKSARIDHQHRAYLAALASAPAGGRTITFPRGDLRSSRHSLPSRWMLHTASALAGHQVHATDFADLDADGVDVVASFASAVTQPGLASSLNERDLAALADVVDHGGDAAQHPLAALTGTGLHLQRQRASSEFTAFDGNLAEVGGDADLLRSSSGGAMSPTRLEQWAACGFRYFLRYVLDVSDRDDPERTDDISALDRGSLIHAILERFVGEAIAAGPPGPDDRWAEADRARLHDIADDVCAEFEAGGRTGRAVNWRVRRDDLRGVLDGFLDADDEFRRSRRATPHAVEVSFGVDGSPPVDVARPDSSTVSLRGTADRLDLTADGRVIVTDYKSGSGKKYRRLADDPFTGGTTLQLGTYAEGALRRTGRDAAEAAYWLVERGDEPFQGYDWTPELRERFATVVGATTAGIEQGVFAADPGEWDTWRMTNEACRYCEFDTVCVRNRGEQAVAKAGAPELAVRVVLAPPEQEGGP
ncbi:MAG: hypothetical protein HKN44_11560 [Ilumatobacter sp.]|nr:hypothetical protein [Ilumatobacter sp.]